MGQSAQDVGRISLYAVGISNKEHFWAFKKVTLSFITCQSVTSKG
jgi:hypothetical protein